MARLCGRPDGAVRRHCGSSEHAVVESRHAAANSLPGLNHGDSPDSRLVNDKTKGIRERRLIRGAACAGRHICCVAGAYASACSRRLPHGACSRLIHGSRLIHEVCGRALCGRASCSRERRAASPADGARADGAPDGACGIAEAAVLTPCVEAAAFIRAWGHLTPLSGRYEYM